MELSESVKSLAAVITFANVQAGCIIKEYLLASNWITELYYVL